MKNKNTKATCRKGVSLLAAAALTAALMGGQVYPAFAETTNKVTAVSSLLPDNVTISEPVALSEVSLPGSDYGTLSWADESYVPSERVQSCEVVLKPFKGVDLSDRNGWDSERGAVVGYVTVVVSSISEKPAQDYEEGKNENTETEAPTGEITEAPSEDEGDKNESQSEENSGGATQEEGSASGDQDASQGGIDSAEDQTASQGGTDSAEDQTVSQGDTSAEDKTPSDKTDDASKDETPSAEKNGTIAEDSFSEDVKDGAAGVSDSENPSTDTDNSASGETPSEAPAAADNGEEKGTEENTADETPAEDTDNIFDREEIVDERSDEVSEDLSEEEMRQAAEVNHSCDGIYVSGIDLPWYVQFRVTSGESYEFTNESGASIFKSYEFELWDLRTNTEYEIPDGEYISVTVPVKEGYEYSIEHLLDNGAMETIIPSVNGSTMVFSTHSFSPFGIAGSKPIVAPEIAEDGYSGATATPTPTAAAQQASVTAAPTSSASVTQAAGSSQNGTSSANTGSSGNTVSDGSTDSSSADTGSADNTSKENSVNTGDDTSIAPFVILVAAAVLIIVAVIVIRKKKK